MFIIARAFVHFTRDVVRRRNLFLSETPYVEHGIYGVTALAAYHWQVLPQEVKDVSIPRKG